MSDTLTTSEIKKRSISGAKWLVVMNGFGMPAAFLIALMLGRIGPEALGTYALVQIMLGVITTFVVYGGQPVLSVFMPKFTNAEERGKFLFTYLMILASFMCLVLSVFWFFPSVFEFLLRREFDMRNFGWFALFAILVVLTEVFANAANGLMLIKIAAIARQMMRLVLFPLVAVLFLLKPEILADHAMPCIFGGFLAGYALAFALSASAVLREPRFSPKMGWNPSKGFWAFSLATMGTTIASFLYANFDRMFVLAIQDVKGLGMYQAVLSVNALLVRIPNIIRPSIIPAFANLRTNERQNDFDKAFSLLCTWTVFPITGISLIVMGFSHQILELFGKAYVEYSHILTLFGFVAIVRSLNTATNTVLTCMEKNAFRFMQTTLNLVAQCSLTFAFVGAFGVMAIAGAKLLCVSVASFSAVVYVFLILRIKRGIPLSYSAAVISGLVMLAFSLWLAPLGWSVALLLTAACVILFILMSRLRVDDLKQVLRLVTKHE